MDDQKVEIKNSQKSLFECNICNGKSFATSRNLKKHIKTIHKGHKDLECDSCGKSFSQAGDLRGHIKTVH